MASDSVMGMEKECDEALRKTVQSIFRESADDKGLLVYFELARNIMASTSSLTKAACLMHDEIFESMKR
jgi:hypothetical protein